jgi:phosphatidylserine/phosphatidylglycerophosphate/cardiolipin synthase-like enzyme
MNLNKLNLLALLVVPANIYCAEKTAKLSAEKAHTLKITDFFKTSKSKGDKDPSLTILPLQIKPKLGMALFSGKEINLFLASAVMNMQPGSQALMSLYDASFHDDKLSMNPLLKSLYNQYEKKIALDTQVILDHKNIKNAQFLLFSNFLKSIGCQVNKFEPTKLIDGESSVFQNPEYGSLHQKFYVFDGCLPDSSSSEKSALAVITSHNSTTSGMNDDQLNDALVIAIPNVINQLRARFNLIKDSASETVKISKDLKASKLAKGEPDFKPIDFGKLNLQKINSDRLELLASPLNVTDQSIIPKIVEEINQETKCIQIASFQFSHAKVVEALIKSLERGVRVECVLNHEKCLLTTTSFGGNVGNLAVSRLKDAIHKNNNNGFVKVESAKYLHHKFYTFHDRQSVITGSLNCSGNSEKNCAEVDVKIADYENFSAYHNYFTKLASTAQIPELTNLESVHQSLIKSKNYSYKLNEWKP